MKYNNITMHGVSDYEDKFGNRVISSKYHANLKVIFKGGSNLLVVSEGLTTANLVVEFRGSNASVKLGANRYKGRVMMSSGSSVESGDNVSCTNDCYIGASEGAKVIVGDDCMFSTNNQIRTDDSHPIYDVQTGNRINVAKDVIIGNHVWLAYDAKILGGSIIRDGSVVGMGSIVKGEFPNNCVLAGVPARVIRKDIAWERPALFTDWGENRPPNSEYWNLTKE